MSDKFTINYKGKDIEILPKQDNEFKPKLTIQETEKPKLKKPPFIVIQTSPIMTALGVADEMFDAYKILFKHLKDVWEDEVWLKDLVQLPEDCGIKINAVDKETEEEVGSFCILF